MSLFADVVRSPSNFVHQKCLTSVQYNEKAAWNVISQSFLQLRHNKNIWSHNFNRIHNRMSDNCTCSASILKTVDRVARQHVSWLIGQLMLSLLLLSLTGSGQTSRLRVTGSTTQVCHLSANSSKVINWEVHYGPLPSSIYWWVQNAHRLTSLSLIGSLTDVYKIDLSNLEWLYFISSGLSVKDLFY